MKTTRAFLLLLTFLSTTVSNAQNDVGISSVVTPFSGCNLSCAPPNIYLQNYTGATIWGGNYQICYNVTGATTYSFCDVINIPNFASGSTFNYSFPDTFCFQIQGNYQFDFTITMIPPFPAGGGDINPANNALSVTITNDTTVAPGVLSMSDSVCQGNNSGLLTLTGNTGYIDYWESSTSGGSPWDSIANTTNTQSYTNLTQTTIYHVHLDGGFCPDSWSQWAVITTVAPPIGGTTVTSASNVCANANAFQVSLSGQTGNVVGWNTSPNCSTWTLDASLGTGVQINPVNISQTTCYQAIVSNGGYCANTTSSSTNVVATPPTVTGTIASSATVCSGNNGDTLFLTGQQGAIVSWIQMDTAGNVTALANIPPAMQLYNNLISTTQYAAVVQNGICPSDTSAFITITVLPSPNVFAGNDATMNLGSTLCLNATGASFYSWTPSTGLDNSTIPNPCFTPGAIGTYTFSVTGTDASGCDRTDQITITVLDTVTVFPPVVCNFVTPNSDGLNDVWNIMNIGLYPDNEVAVYNNHGQEVYTKAGYANEWDGTYNGNQLPDGSYYYVVTINSIDRTFKGIVTITDTRKP